MTDRFYSFRGGYGKNNVIGWLWEPAFQNTSGGVDSSFHQTSTCN